jgi:hypothetical protein
MTAKYEGQKNEDGDAHGFGVEIHNDFLYKSQFENGHKLGVGIIKFTKGPKKGTVIKIEWGIGTITYPQKDDQLISHYAGDIDETNFEPKWYGQYTLKNKTKVVGLLSEAGNGVGKVIMNTGGYYLGNITNFKQDRLLGYKEFDKNGILQLQSDESNKYANLNATCPKLNTTSANFNTTSANFKGKCPYIRTISEDDEAKANDDAEKAIEVANKALQVEIAADEVVKEVNKVIDEIRKQNLIKDIVVEDVVEERANIQADNSKNTTKHGKIRQKLIEYIKDGSGSSTKDANADLSRSGTVSGNGNGSSSSVNGSSSSGNGWKENAYKTAAVGLGAAGIYYLYKNLNKSRKKGKRSKPSKRKEKKRSKRSKSRVSESSSNE